MKPILRIIIGLEKEYGEDVSTEKVFALAEEEGIEREKAEDIIEALYRDGFIFYPPSEKEVMRVVRPEIETSPLSQSEKKPILKIIIGLEKEYGEDVPTEKVFALAEKEEIEREKAEDIIKALYRDGFILYLPSEKEVIRVVR